MRGFIFPALMVLAPLLILYFLLRGGGKSAAARRARLAAARPGKARVVSLSSVLRHRGPNKIPLVELSLEVEPAEGAPYLVTAPWYVDASGMPRAQPGKELQVMIDAQDPQVVYPIPSETCFEYAWGFVRLGIEPK